MGIEERIAKLEARQSIDDLIGDLARAFDGGPSAELLRPLFTDDARFEIDRYGVLEGGDAITAGVVGNSGQGFSWTLHYLVSPKVELAADCSSAQLDFMLWEVATSASGRAYWIGGRYFARAVRSGEGEAGSRWRFASLTLEAQLISRNPAGWSDKPATLQDA